jgi:methylated-DNA-[protein]-cysteine S-methyltransferase
MDLRYTLFPTAIGPVGLVWHDGGLVGVQLPEAGVRETRARMTRRFPDATPQEPPTDPAILDAMAAISALLADGDADLSAIPVDLAQVPAFNRRVYDLVRAIPPGRTRTYGDVATELGEPGAAQAVGQAMGHNPVPIVVPCHRVVAAGGRLGGFSARGGNQTKRRMLEIEGAGAGAAVADELTLFSGTPARSASA